MKPAYWLAIIPFIGILSGPMLHNEVHPLILGMPFPLGWIAVWLVITAIIMLILYNLDPRNKEDDR
jgi:tellurite resistance protein TehA-like permease